jgi:hypothetical protein
MLLVVTPVPSCPEEFAPQHTTLRFARRAQEWAEPAATSSASVSPATATGTGDDTIVPLPSCPDVLLPQQTTAPVERLAHVCE